MAKKSTVGAKRKKKPDPSGAKKTAKDGDWSKVKLTVPVSIALASRRAIRFKNGG